MNDKKCAETAIRTLKAHFAILWDEIYNIYGNTIPEDHSKVTDEVIRLLDRIKSLIRKEELDEGTS